MKKFILKISSMAALAATLTLTNSCGPADTYQGNGTWLKADGTTYRGAAPLRVTSAQLAGSPFVRERSRVTENRSTNNQGQTVIREQETVTVEMDFIMTVTLESGEQHQLSFSVRGDRNSSRFASRSFTGSNGYSYTVSGSVLLSSFNPTFSFNINSKGIATWQGNLRLR